MEIEKHSDLTAFTIGVLAASIFWVLAVVITTSIAPDPTVENVCRSQGGIVTLGDGYVGCNYDDMPPVSGVWRLDR